MSGWQNIKRKDLYNLVWQQPMTRLARHYGLSDVGLAKLCRRHDIPRPPRGYWAQKEHGKAPKQTQLPKPQEDINIQLRELGPETPPSTQRVEATGKLDREKSDEMKITVATDLESAHPLIQRAREQLQHAKVDADGLIRECEKVPLHVVTSKDSLYRALLIMNAVIRALEDRGYVVKNGPQTDVDGVILKFSISEELETRQEPDEHTSLDGPYKFNHSRVKEVKIPSGLLTLSIDNGEVRWGEGVRRRWRDTEKSRLENRLNKFIAGLIEVSVKVREFEAEKKAQAEREQQERLQKEAAARVLEAKQKQYKKEKARVTKLLTHAENLQRSRNLRELISAVKSSPAILSQIAPDISLEKWLEWATQQADRLDPLLPSPPSILDDTSLEEKDSDRNYGYSSGNGYDTSYNYGYRNHWRR